MRIYERYVVAFYSDWTYVQKFRAIGQLLMEILHLKTKLEYSHGVITNTLWALI